MNKLIGNKVRYIILTNGKKQDVSYKLYFASSLLMINKSKLENIYTINHNLNILFKLHQGALSFFT